MILALPCSMWASDTDFRARARDLVARMTLEEKASLTSGRNFWSTKPIERLGIPSIFMTDGPHGLRKAAGANFFDSIPATCFPTASALAASWNVELVREVGAALGKESQANDVQILLGPGVNMKRSPLGGRNFEYFSEDPLLAGRLAAAFINGVQGEGVGTSVKHYAANNQEFERMVNDSIVDERTLREIYLPAFEIAVREAQPWTIMCSYNRVNGVQASQNRLLLHDILKNEWGFRGYVVSDWGAVVDRVAGIDAGLHLEMPSSLGRTNARIVAAVRGGELSEARLDEVATDLLAVFLRSHAARKAGTGFDQEAHHRLARRAAAEGIVLLKNDGLLPLDLAKTKRIAVIGAFAQSPRYQGSGSSRVNPTRIDNALHQLKQLAGRGTAIDYVAGYAEDGSTDDASLAEARRAAKAADVALVFAGLPDAYESEGFDREHIDLPEGHNRLIRAVAAAQPRTAVVLLNGSAVAMPWVEQVPAIVEGWLGGQAGGGAIADVLTGRVNPSGKLSETFPVRLEDTPTYLNFPGLDGEAWYGEGVFIGYRYYDAKEITPLFPFGHGLSYTTFAYGDAAADAASIDDATGTRVRVKVRNTGTRAGQEIVQLYVREQEARVRRPEKELRHFAKVALTPGEEKTVTFQLGHRDFAYWDTRIHDWAVKSGKFDVLVDGSSRELPVSLTLDVRASRMVYPELTRESLVKAFAEQPQALPVYEEIMLTAFKAFGIDVSGAATGTSFKALEEGNAMMTAFVRDMPVWKVVSMSRGEMSDERLDALIAKARK